MSLLQINSALPLAEPLLEQQQNNKDDKRDNSDERLQVEFRSKIKFVTLGALTGFFIQVVSLGAYASILVHFNGMSLQESGALSMDGFFSRHSVDTNIDEEPVGGNAYLYTLLSVLTQLDLVVYVLIWVGFTCTMTRNGMDCIRSNFFASSASSSIRRRYVFILGVCFLVGIVFGAFTAWTAIDIYLDFPIPLEPILATVVVDLALCYMMVVCFDMGKSRAKQPNDNEEEYSDDEDDDQAPLCC